MDDRSIWRDRLTRWGLPIAVALVVAVLAFWALGLWERHNLQHLIAAQDHLLLQQLTQFVNTQVQRGVLKP